ncbi:hypothetical protein [Cytobacillus gottheilii]|uniref:hypothetical protein n=1 Tax=Cytobacillus gottheilii TaxID=859144 RepID=UPI0009BAFB4A|nr:hypothetical protein [Cytobacillus gottheilii]
MKKQASALQQLKMGYFVARMERFERESNKCVHCWQGNCGCNTKSTVSDSAFINYEGNELQYV